MASPKLLADSSCVFDSLPTPFSLFGPPSHFLSPFPLFISQLIFHYLQQHENMHILVSIDPNGKPDIFSSMYFSLSLSLRSTFLRRMPLTKKRRVCRAKPRRTLARGRLVLTPWCPPTPLGWSLWLSRPSPGGQSAEPAWTPSHCSAAAGRAYEIISALPLISHVGGLRVRKGKCLPPFSIIVFRGRMGTRILISRLPECFAAPWLLPNMSCLGTLCRRVLVRTTYFAF